MAKILFLLSFFFPVFLFFLLEKKSHIPIIQQENVWRQDFVSSKSLSFYENLESLPKDYYVFSSDHFLALLNYRGQIIYKKHLPHGLLAATSECCHLLFKEKGSLSSKNEEQTDKYPLLYSNNGQRLFSFDQRGYGLLSPDGTIVVFISTDGGSVSIYDRNGKKYLQNHFVNTLITDVSFSAYNNSFALGGVNGKVVTFDHQGKITFEKTLTHHKYAVVKSVHLSYSSEWLTVLSGQEPERLYLYQKLPNNKGYVKKWSQLTRKNRTEKVLLQIDERENVLYEQMDNHIIQRRLKNGKILNVFSFDAIEKADYMIVQFLPKNIQKKTMDESQDLIAVNAVEENVSYLALLQSQSLKPVWEKNFPFKILNMRLTYHKDYYYLLIQSSKLAMYYRLKQR